MTTRCGYVAVVGRPNVGKSTLVNRILNHKISITSRKPQTTRHQLLGIKTRGDVQTLYVDTPGMHEKTSRAINRYMNRAARTVLADVDLVVMVLDRSAWMSDDDVVAAAVSQSGAPLLIAVNKVDLIRDRPSLLPYLQQLQERFPTAELVPVSAETGDNIDRLERLIEARLPEGPMLFPRDQLTDRSERFMVAEIIREKMMRQLGDELPYALTVQIDRFADDGKTVHIDATAFVEREGQKIILVGKNGERIKRIGSDARRDIEPMLDRPVMLRLWVKVKSGWSDDDRALKTLGYDDV